MMYDDVKARLTSTPFPHSQLAGPKGGGGVYAHFLTPQATLGDSKVGHNRLLYISMTEVGLNIRSHFDRNSSGFSTFRRSLGAILKADLNLRASPRVPDPGRKNVANYRFADNGGKALSTWIADNLLAKFTEVTTGRISDPERDLVKDLQPPLNLEKWKNTQRRSVMELRAMCASEAEDRH